MRYSTFNTRHRHGSSAVTQTGSWALAMCQPAELCAPFTTPLARLHDLDCPFHDRTVIVTRCGRLSFGRRRINLSTVFAGQKVGVREVSDRIGLVSVMHHELCLFDHETCRLESAENTFAAIVSPMSSE